MKDIPKYEKYLAYARKACLHFVSVIVIIDMYLEGSRVFILRRYYRERERERESVRERETERKRRESELSVE